MGCKTIALAAACAALVLLTRQHEAPAPVAARTPVAPLPPLVALAAAPPLPVAAAPTVHDVEAAVRDARAQGADENAVYRLRAAALPARTIAMLSEREQQEQQWRARVAAWQAASARLAADDAAGRARLRDGMFSEEERDLLATHETRGPQLVQQAEP